MNLYGKDPEGGAVAFVVNPTDPYFKSVNGNLMLQNPNGLSALNAPRQTTVDVTASDQQNAFTKFTLSVTFQSYCESNPNPCQNQGTCEYCDKTSDLACPTLDYKCTCAAGTEGNCFTGTFCDTIDTIDNCNLRQSNGNDSSKAASVGSGAIAAIVVGVIFLIILVVLLVLLYFRNNQRAQNQLDLNISVQHAAINENFIGAKPPVGFGADGSFQPGLSNPMYDWYHPEMSRQESSDFLDGLAEGAFVVRDSAATPGWHMMVIKHENEVLHEKIKLNEDGEYELLPSKTNRSQPKFKSVPEVIEFYRQERDDSPYILCGAGLSNPIYDNHHLGAKKHGESKPGYIMTDPNAPNLPLKRKDVEQVQILAVDGQEDMYTNSKEASESLNYRKTGAVQYRVSATNVDTLAPEDENMGYMGVGGT